MLEHKSNNFQSSKQLAKHFQVSQFTFALGNYLWTQNDQLQKNKESVCKIPYVLCNQSTAYPKSLQY